MACPLSPLDVQDALSALKSLKEKVPAGAEISRASRSGRSAMLWLNEMLNHGHGTACGAE